MIRTTRHREHDPREHWTTEEWAQYRMDQHNALAEESERRHNAFRYGPPAPKPTYLYAPDEGATPLQSRRDIFANAVLYYTERIESYLGEYFHREEVSTEWTITKQVLCTKQGADTTDCDVLGCDAVISTSMSTFPANVDKNTIAVLQQSRDGERYVSTMPAMRCIINVNHGAGKWFKIAVKLICDTNSNAQTRRITVANVHDASGKIIYRWLVSPMFTEMSSKSYAKMKDNDWLYQIALFPRDNNDIINESITWMFDVGVIGAFFRVVKQFPLTIELQISGKTRYLLCESRHRAGEAFFSVSDPTGVCDKVEDGKKWHGGKKFKDVERVHKKTISTLREFELWALRVCPGGEADPTVVVPADMESFTQLRALLNQVNAYMQAV